jgi:uncharacterized delta-60 repeat protein
MAKPLWLEQVRSTLNRRQLARSRRKPLPLARPTVEVLEDRRMLNAGALDPTFGSGGIVTTNLGSPDDEATNVFVQSNGELLVVGFTQDTVNNDSPLTLSKYQANGSLDTSYGNGGVVITSLTTSPIPDLAFQPDGSIVILSGNQVARYSANGSPDTSFGISGIVTFSGFIDFNGNPSHPNVLALQSDGKILIAGSVAAGSDAGGPVIDTLLERLNADGSLDTTFGAGGKVTKDLGIPDKIGYPANQQASSPDALVVLPDGRILVGGSVPPTNSSLYGNFDGFVARFNSDGSSDTSFGSGGEIVLLNNTPGGLFYDNLIDVDPSASAVVFGSSNGVYPLGNVSPIPTNITVQPDGKMLVGLGPFNFTGALRLNQDGSLDTGFAQPTNDVLVLRDVGPIHEDANGGIFAIPFVQDSAGNEEFALSRYNSDGTPDLSFGSDGTGSAVIDQATESFPYDFAIQSDGNIVLAGATFDPNKQGYDFELMRLTGTNFFSQTGLQSALDSQPPVNPATGNPTVTLDASTQTQADAFLSLFQSPGTPGFTPLAPPAGATTPIDISLTLAPGISLNEAALSIPQGIRVQINGGTWYGGSPALTLSSGDLTITGATFLNATDAPTILVTGGSLALRNDVIQESTGFTDAAIAVTGGTVDLGTATSLGNNTINVNGTGQFVQNGTANAISAVGDTFESNGTILTAPTLSFASLTASVNPSTLNQSVTLATSVLANGSSGTPTGSVDFFDATTNTDLGSVALSNGSASLSVSTLAVGNHVIRASYGGDSTFLPSLAVLTQQVHYHFSGFLAPLNSTLALALGRTVPIKFQLTDYNGAFISSLSAVQSLVVSGPSGTITLSGSLRYDPTSNQYVVNWQTKGLLAGNYSITLTLIDGTSPYTKTVQLNKSGNSSGLTTVSAGGTGTAPGGLLGGDITLYVDNSNGDLTADELARIQDAVTAADAVTEPYGVAVTEVTDPTLADVTLNMDTTSAVGGYADGVLGCTTDAGQITIINGWNFYAGSDATQIGSSQYDFETVVEHELGHALGLGHSTDSTSVMYATLNSGTVNRTLTTADLNVADTDTTGACGLHAGAIVGQISNLSYETGFLSSDEKPGFQGRYRVDSNMVFALLGAEELPLGSGRLTLRSGEPSRTANAMPIDAMFASVNERPIFAAQSQRDSQLAQFDVPLFPDPDGSDTADTMADYIAADWMD